MSNIVVCKSYCSPPILETNLDISKAFTLTELAIAEHFMRGTQVVSLNYHTTLCMFKKNYNTLV